MTDEKSEKFPILSAFVEEGKISTNVSSVLEDSEKVLARVKTTELKTDEDFKQQKDVNKKLTNVRNTLVDVVDQVRSEFKDLYAFETKAEQVRKNYTAAITYGTKAVTAEQKKRVAEVTQEQYNEVKKFVEAVLTHVTLAEVDFEIKSSLAFAAKNLRTIKSVQEKTQICANELKAVYAEKDGIRKERYQKLVAAGLTEKTKHLVPDIDSLIMDTGAVDIFLDRLAEYNKALDKKTPALSLKVTTESVKDDECVEQPLSEEKEETASAKRFTKKADKKELESQKNALLASSKAKVNHVKTLLFLGLKNEKQVHDALQAIDELKTLIQQMQ